MINKELTIINKLGLHARAAVKFVNLAKEFDADIQLTANHRCVNGKSIMGIMMLAASRGTTITINIDGVDEKQALEQLEKLVQDRFGEPE
ncbi:MAG TPA: HPr family phosphocarrier protein [Gammaproteobacteria bacterium]|nr:HPr family phosphocarrier protein [Gammaproteobacteria bacterium]